MEKSERERVRKKERVRERKTEIIEYIYRYMKIYKCSVGVTEF